METGASPVLAVELQAKLHPTVLTYGVICTMGWCTMHLATVLVEEGLTPKAALEDVTQEGEQLALVLPCKVVGALAQIRLAPLPICSAVQV